jgi:ornithine cyclodeaminase/alanine dehydrogenase
MKIGKEILYLTKKDVANVKLSMSDIINIIEKAFIEKSHGRYEMPSKIGIHTQENAFIHAMPCWLPSSNVAGIKWVSGYPENQTKGLPYIAGLLILNDPETGLPVAIMDCSWITAMRTGAVSGLAAKYVANPKSEVLGIIGCGVQGRTNIQAILTTLKNIKRVYAFDLYPDVMKNFVTEQSKKYDLEIIGVNTHKEVVVESDILITAGPIVHNPNGIIEKQWLKEGVTIMPVDFDCMFKPYVLEKTMDKYFTDDTNQYKKFKNMGYFINGPSAPPEIADVIAGKILGRIDKNEKIVSMNIGMALDDMPTAKQIYNKAIEKSIGQILPL